MPRRLYFSPKKSIQVFAIVTFSLAAFATVRAEPVTVGTATVVNGQFSSPAITINLASQNFSANVFDEGGISNIGNFGIFPCSRSSGSNTPCTGANLGYQSAGDLRGTFTLNGTTFNADVINSLNFTFTAPNFVIPPELLDDAAVLVTAPFTFAGIVVTGQSGVPFTLEGQGTVQLLLTRQTVGQVTGLFLEREDFIFGPTVSGVTVEPVPEPATMALFLTGLAGAAVRMRHSFRRHR